MFRFKAPYPNIFSRTCSAKNNKKQQQQQQQCPGNQDQQEQHNKTHNHVLETRTNSDETVCKTGPPATATAAAKTNQPA